MNNTQKCAWFGLITSTLMLGFGINTTIEMLSSGTHLVTVFRIWGLLIVPFALATFVYLFITVVLAKKLDYDERDQFIDKRAALAGSAAALIALTAASVIPQFIVGQTGSVPAWLLPIINFGVVIIGGIVYFAATLIQYGRRGKGEKS